jgi:predicted DNA-binding protein
VKVKKVQKEELVPYTVRLKRETAEAIDSLSEKHGVSRQKLLSALIEAALKAKDLVLEVR